MDVLELSRLQFAANITFHFLFPSITIALGWFLFFFKLRFNSTKNVKWMDIYFFWTKVFALCFALGVVTGITMSFQFGTNWPGFMNTVGNVAGPLLGYEVLTAFFLEASFLGVMLFGYRRVKPWVHTLATFLVAFGTTLSAFWILVLNSWMQTPQGIIMIEGEAVVTSWFEIIFNPSMPYRLIHTLLASVLTASFLIIGLSLNLISCKKSFSDNNDTPSVKLTNPFTKNFLIDNLRKDQPRLVLNSEIDKVLRDKLKTDPVVKNFYSAIKLNAMGVMNEPYLERIKIGRRLLHISREMLYRINTNL